MTNVLRDELIEIGVDSCCENMAVFQVVRHRRHEIFESIDEGFGKYLMHARKPSSNLLRRITELRQSATHLDKN